MNANFTIKMQKCAYYTLVVASLAIISVIILFTYSYFSGLSYPKVKLEFPSHAKVNTDVMLHALSFRNKPMKFLYNRVSKCGSGSTYLLFDSLPQLNVKKPDVSNLKEPDYSYQLKIINKVRQSSPPSVYIQHLHFIDFERFGYNNPIYINLVRDPMDRMISAYNYAWNFNEALRDFEVCVEENQGRCGSYCKRTGGYIKENLVAYFAGQNTEQFCGEPRLQLAKYNIERYYAIVGYLENYTQFLNSLEWTFPAAFTNLTKAYTDNLKKLTSYHQTQGYYLPNNESRRILIGRMRFDYDLYYFIKARFDTFYKRLRKVHQPTV